LLRFTHWLPERAEYRCSFKSGASGSGGGGVASGSAGFDAPASVIAPPAGAAGAVSSTGVDVELSVGFEPCALGEAVRDVLVLTSAAGGSYEVPLTGQCVPPKPQGPIDVSKVSGLDWKRACGACGAHTAH
jgi:hydrocephalus-inducing protein